MRNKRLIAIFSVLLAVTVIVLLSSIIFSVKNINTRCLNHTYSDAALDTQIIAAADGAKGKNIFLVNEKKVISAIQNQVPNVRVVNLESKAPNRITVHYVQLFDYFQLSSGGFYYPLTFDGRVIEENSAKSDHKISVVSNRTGRLDVGEYLYSGANREILTEVVASFERLDLSESRATERFRLIDLENENDALYIGLVGSPIMIKINNVSNLGELFGKIRLGYSVFLSDKFDRSPNENGQYRMVNVVSPTSAMDPLSDYIG